jgi:hypothetical protein
MKGSRVMNLSVLKRFIYGGTSIFLFVTSLPVLAAAGAKIKIDDTKYFQIGMGLRTSVSVNENNATNTGEESFDTSLDNMRLYTVSQVHKNIQVEFNTDLSGDSVNLLDAVAKIDFGFVDLWVGRQLPPSDRSNLNGPYYLNAAYSYPIVQSFGNLGVFAGRDNGFAFHGDAAGGKFEWAYGVFEGTSGGSDVDDSVRHTGRIDIALGDAEPGFYTGSTYFGAKQLTTLGISFHHEEDAAGTAADKGDFSGIGADILIEKTISGGAVLNLEGAYYDWDLDNKSGHTGDNTTNLLQGDSYLILASYLMPDKTSIGGIQGQLQPYFRYQSYDRDQINAAGSRGTTDRTEAGLNYVIDGFNAKITALWYVDTDHDNGVDKNTGMLAMQFQL